MHHGHSPQKSRRTNSIFLLIGSAIGAVVAYFLDPDRGRTRRAKTGDQAGATLRRLSERGERTARRVASDAAGVVERIRKRERHYVAPNDATLAHKVESELFGRDDVPKGSINVNAERGVVVLRGEVDQPGQIEGLEAAVREIPGVLGVENLLHLPGTPAPNKEEVRRLDSAS
ncbi:MAG: BON domain-containing protein [Actinomycetota bacterium]|nr:BON domain-containing protein [Actinomycetota bacterium]